MIKKSKMNKKPVLGIDIGHDQLKLALVAGGQVMKTASVQMPENLLKEGRFTSPETMASLIREAMKENGMKTNRAAILLPNELVYVKNVDMPMMSEEQLTYNLPFEFHDYITGEVQDYIFDYAIIDVEEDAIPDGGAEGIDENEMPEGPEENLHLMAVGVEKTVVEELESMLRKAGLRMVKSAPELCSYISLIRAQAPKPFQESEEYGILDLGYHSITMYMYKGDQHETTREFEIGLSALDDVVADAFGVEKHLAHTYVMSNFENCLEKEECINFYDNIAVELMRAINFYQFSNQGSSLDTIWISGGGAMNLPLIRTIDETLEAELHPSYKLLPAGESSPQLNSFVQAIGVTLEI